MASIFIAVPSYADPDLPFTIESAIRNRSGYHELHFGICEQVTSYCSAYILGHVTPDDVLVDLSESNNQLIGVGGARHQAEGHYTGEDYQVQIDSHVRFDPNWDDAVVRILKRLPSSAVISSCSFPDPWQDRHKIPIVEFDRFENGLPAGHVRMADPKSGNIDEAVPARTVMGGAIYGRAWCEMVPADPHILFNGEESALAARLWTHGRSLYHARAPWVQPIAGTYHPGTIPRPWQRDEWDELNAGSMQRVKALLTGGSLKADDRFGLGSVHSLAEWVEYSGIDFEAATVTAPWP